MGDVHAERVPEAPMDPTDPWGTLGAHVVEAKGARGARFGGGVSVVRFINTHWRRRAFYTPLILGFSHALWSCAFRTSKGRQRSFWW